MATCPRCSAEVAANAQFCPKCGQDVSALTPASSEGKSPAQARREIILGWVLLVAGMGFVLAALLVHGWGVRALFAGLFGLTLFVCGLGSLTGDSAKPKKKRKSKKSEQRG